MSLELLRCLEYNGIGSFSIRASIFKLWRVLSRFSREFRDTEKISTRSIKTKLSNEIDFGFLLHMCLGKGEMTTIPMHLLTTLFKLCLYCAKIALNVIEKIPNLENHQNRKPSIHEATRQGCL